jgi:RNA polymerase sigma-70 factor, ECF subfamily
MKGEEIIMRSDSVKRQNFRDSILPELEVFLQFSLWLTKNGRDAAELMREAMVEAYRSWDESMPEESCKMWLYRILTRRFFGGTQNHTRPLVPIFDDNDDNIDESLVKNDRLFIVATTNARLQSWLTGESDEEINYFEAVASLPAMCRSAMILSYVEGFTNKEIADLAGVHPHAVESILDRGRKFMREELFAYFMDNDGSDMVAVQGAASG